MSDENSAPKPEQTNSGEGQLSINEFVPKLTQDQQETVDAVGRLLLHNSTSVETGEPINLTPGLFVFLVESSGGEVEEVFDRLHGYYASQETHPQNGGRAGELMEQLDKAYEIFKSPQNEEKRRIELGKPNLQIGVNKAIAKGLAQLPNLKFNMKDIERAIEEAIIGEISGNAGKRTGGEGNEIEKYQQFARNIRSLI